MQWTSSNIWDQKIFRHFDLSVFCLRVFSLIANVIFLQPQTELNEALLGDWLS